MRLPRRESTRRFSVEVSAEADTAGGGVGGARGKYSSDLVARREFGVPLDGGCALKLDCGRGVADAG
jgi:hypothetical protein